MSDLLTATRTEPKARVIAFYLPQFHPIPENDAWWSPGFTEWTNTAKARPLFRGHYQPHLPADLGFYDLRVPEVRQAQADMARSHGVESFCYWHYWFAGKRLLERPFQEVLDSGQPDFPFCLAWANETWTGIWHGEPGRVLMEQTYPGEDDYRRHFDFLLRAFSDPRYTRVDGKPLLFIYKPLLVPNCRRAMDLWRDLAQRAGLPGLHLVCFAPDPGWSGRDHGFDAVSNFPHAHWQHIRPCLLRCWAARALRRMGIKSRWPQNVVRYRDAIGHMGLRESRSDVLYPCVVPNWDNTARSGTRGWVLHDSTPEVFADHLRDAISRVATLPPEQRIVFIKSWNEWAEGNHLEPDTKFQHRYLRELRQQVCAEAEAAASCLSS